MHGTSGRTRTGTLLRATDFESVVSTNFTTLAIIFLKLPTYELKPPEINLRYSFKF